MNGYATTQQVLEAIQARFVASLSLDPTRVILVARDDVPHFGAEKDILIAASDWRNESPEEDGTGRMATPIRRSFDITLRMRMRLDKANADSAWLTNAARGFMAFEHDAMDAIHNFYPTRTTLDGDEFITRSPLKLISGGRYDRRKRRQKAPRGWGQSVLRVEARYLLDLDRSWQ
jgi:hypothetical protein